MFGGWWGMPGGRGFVFVFAPLVIFFVAVAMMSVVARVLRRMLAGGPRRGAGLWSETIRVACRNPLCEHENRRAARFCARCGAPLHEPGRGILDG